MVKKLITEDFNLKKVDYVSKEGKRSVFVMIEPKTSEDTFKYKDTLRKFNAIFHRGGMLKVLMIGNGNICIKKLHLTLIRWSFC